ncbi:acyltransferase family protein [Streptomyces sp. NPDC055099]
MTRPLPVSSPNSVSRTPPLPGPASSDRATATRATETVRLPGSVPRKSSRNLYLDFLRALALVRVVMYHTFNWAWLTLAFPAMGVMFALAGSLMARSLDRRDRTATAVVRARMRRLLPPVWLFGLIVVGVMLLSGWRPDEDGDTSTTWPAMLFWVVPLGDPPAAPDDWAQEIVAPLWYIRAYLLFVLFSPLLLRMFRRLPRSCVIGFLALAAVAQAEITPLPARVEDSVVDLAIFGACWLLGFAHRDGMVKELSTALVWTLGAGVMAVGGWFAMTHRTEEGYDLGAIPLAQALWSFGFVLLLLRFGPKDDSWVIRHRPLHAAVVWFNARAVTIYLWHEVALVCGILLVDQMWKVPAMESYLPLDTQWFLFLVAWPLIVVAVLLIGWTEDWAAKRPLRLWPRPAGRGR